jgi:ABC-type phosphate transport system ATPase subunit
MIVIVTQNMQQDLRVADYAAFFYVLEWINRIQYDKTIFKIRNKLYKLYCRYIWLNFS